MLYTMTMHDIELKIKNLLKEVNEIREKIKKSALIISEKRKKEYGKIEKEIISNKLVTHTSTGIKNVTYSLPVNLKISKNNKK